MNAFDQQPADIFDLVEMSNDGIAAAFRRLSDAKEPVQIREHHQGEFFEVFKVASSDRIYEVVRLGYFVRCNCKSFEHTKACKHVAATLPKVCIMCLERPMHTNLKCYDCYYKSEGFARRGTPVTKVLAA